MATETNVKLIAARQPEPVGQVYITTRQHEHGVQIVATRGDAESVLMTISNNFTIQRNRNVNVLLGFPRVETFGLCVAWDDLNTLPQPEPEKP